jgi:hypothetical protein
MTELDGLRIGRHREVGHGGVFEIERRVSLTEPDLPSSLFDPASNSHEAHFTIRRPFEALTPI